MNKSLARLGSIADDRIQAARESAGIVANAAQDAAEGVTQVASNALAALAIYTALQIFGVGRKRK